MTITRARFAGILAILLFAGSLILLQTIYDEKGLVFCLPAYAVIAIGTLVAVGIGRIDWNGHGLVLASTAIFFGYLIVRALTSPAPYFARADLFCMLAALCVYGVIATILVRPGLRMTLILLLVGFGLVHVVIGLVQAGFGENLSIEGVERVARATGYYVNPDHLAGLLEVLALLALSITCWSRWPRWSKVLVGYLSATCIFGVVLTGSRGGYLSLVTGLVVFVVLSLIALRRAGNYLLLKSSITALIVLVTGFVALGVFMQKSAPLKHAVENIITDQGRTDLWRAAIEQWKLQPIIGTGSGTYLFYGREFRPEKMQIDPVDVHNDYLHLLCEYGVLGAAGFLFFFIAHLRHGWRAFCELGPERVAAGNLPLSNRLALNIGAFCATAAYVFHSAVDFNLHIPANALLLALVFGLLANPGLRDSAEAPACRMKALLKLALVIIAATLLVCSAALYRGEYYKEQARMALGAEEPGEAINLARQAMRYDARNPLVFFYLGRGLLATAHLENDAKVRTPLYEEALSAFERGRELVPLDETYPLEKASIYDELGRFAEAEEMFALARARDPRSKAIAQHYRSHLQQWHYAEKIEPGETGK